MQQGREASSDLDRTNFNRIETEIINTINNLNCGLSEYPIRELVKQSEKFGQHLKDTNLDMAQVRKFLDAVNGIKATLAEYKAKYVHLASNATSQEVSKLNSDEIDQQCFKAIETSIVLLKPKLAYAAARQSAAKPLSKVIAAAVEQIHTLSDFERLVQLVESIVAYHKAANPKKQNERGKQ